MSTPEKFTSRHARWISPVFLMLAFYTFGAATMDHFVIYHTWRFVGEADFIKMHIESGSRIIPFFVLPTFIMTIFLVLLFWHRPKAVSRTLVWIALACVTIAWLSSAFIQIPMQAELDKGKNEELLDMLLLTDWIRVVPSFVLPGVAFVMLKRSLQA